MSPAVALLPAEQCIQADYIAGASAKSSDAAGTQFRRSFFVSAVD